MTWRSERFRRLVSTLDCGACGATGPSQTAHRNEGKGMGLKVSDALCAALCPACHYELDQGKSMSKQERRDFWNRAYINTVQKLIEEGRLWM